MAFEQAKDLRTFALHTGTAFWQPFHSFLSEWLLSGDVPLHHHQRVGFCMQPPNVIVMKQHQGQSKNNMCIVWQKVATAHDRSKKGESSFILEIQEQGHHQYYM